VSRLLQNTSPASSVRRDPWMLMVAKASLLVAALIIISTIAINAAFRSAIRHLATPRR
jgi:hypothetical protein